MSINLIEKLEDFTYYVSLELKENVLNTDVKDLTEIINHTNNKLIKIDDYYFFKSHQKIGVIEVDNIRKVLIADLLEKIKKDTKVLEDFLVNGYVGLNSLLDEQLMTLYSEEYYGEKELYEKINVISKFNQKMVCEKFDYTLTYINIGYVINNIIKSIRFENYLNGNKKINENIMEINDYIEKNSFAEKFENEIFSQDKKTYFDELEEFLTEEISIYFDNKEKMETKIDHNKR